MMKVLSISQRRSCNVSEDDGIACAFLVSRLWTDCVLDSLLEFNAKNFDDLRFVW